MRSVKYPLAACRFSLETGYDFTRPHEIHALLWLASLIEGNILEIGCNRGGTTLQLATTFSSRTIFAVDCPQPPNLASEQRHEVPAEAEICVKARHLANVRTIIADSSQLSLESLDDVGTVFIDGDHSYHGVKADTENALKYFEDTGGGLIIWHDASPPRVAWCEVWQYLQDLSMTGVDVRVIAGTWLAYSYVKGSGRRAARDELLAWS